MLERNAVCLQENAQPRGGFGEGSYRERGGQIMQRPEGQYKEGYQNRGEQLEPTKNPNAMEVNKGREEDRTCFVYEKQGHIAKNYWQRKKRKRRVVEMLQELAKDNDRQ